MNNSHRIRHSIDEYFADMDEHPSLQSKILAQTRGEIKVKKKLSAGFVLIITCLLLSISVFAASIVTGYIRFANEENQPTSAVIANDTLYMMTNHGLAVWSPSEEQEHILLSTQALQEYNISIDAYLFDNQGLMLLDTESKAIWSLVDDQLQLVRRYDEIQTNTDDLYLQSVICNNNTLYLLYTQDVDTVLYRWVLTSNDWELVPIEGILNLAQYKQNALLGVQRNFDTGDSLVVIDTQTNDVPILSTMPLLSIDGVAYSQTHDAIYAIVDGSLQCFIDGSWEVVRERSIPTNSFYFAAFQDGYVSVSANGAQYITFDGEEAGNHIQIAGYTSANNLAYNFDNAFEATHLGVTVIRNSSPHYCAVEVMETIDSHSTVDLFHVKLDAAIMELINNGTLAAISLDSLGESICDTMLSQIQDAILTDDVLYAIPSEISVYAWESAIQRSETALYFSDLLAQNVTIENAMTNTSWNQEDYVRYLLEQTILQYDQTLDFTSSDFIYYLEQLKAANLSQWATYIQTMDYAANKTYLMYGQHESVYPVLPPTLTAQQDPQVSARLMVYILNPNSQNKEEAMEYLSYIASHYDSTTAALLMPETATSVLFDAFQQMIDEENALDDPSQTMIDDILNDPTFWLITEDALSFYRDCLSPHINLRLSPLLEDINGWHDPTFPAMVDVVLAYMSGDGTAEECGESLNELMRLK